MTNLMEKFFKSLETLNANLKEATEDFASRALKNPIHAGTNYEDVLSLAYQKAAVDEYLNDVTTARLQNGTLLERQETLDAIILHITERITRAAASPYGSACPMQVMQKQQQFKQLARFLLSMQNLRLLDK